jgi:hypothetical protein
MSLKHLKIEADVTPTNVDTLPTNDFTVPTNIYEMIISSAYMDIAASGAEGLRFVLKPADGSPQEVRDAYWVTSGTEKGGTPYYMNKDGKKQYLKGFSQANLLTTIACGKPLADLKEEDKILKLWNWASQSEENTKVRWLPELIGKPVMACILKVRDNKKKKEGNKWVDLPQDRTFNEVDKLLYPSGHAVTEKNAGEDATFKDRWAKMYPAGETIDRYTEIPGSEPDLPIEGEEEEGLTSEGITALFGAEAES